MVKLIGVVILYHPDTKVLFDHINSYLPLLDRLLMYDNSESPSSELTKCIQLQGSDKLDYHFFGQNEGISKRLNMAAAYGISQGCQYLLTMDQDSAFEAGDFERYLLKIERNSFENAAQFGVNCQPEFTPQSATPQKVNNLITSGSIIDLQLFKQVGEFDEKLFIDFVDTEFSYRVVGKGFCNIQFSDIVLKHRIGYLKMGRSWKNFKKTPRILHSPIRVYYILRNGLYLLNNSPYVHGDSRKELLTSMKMIKNDLLYSDHLLSVYKNVCSAIVDFVTKKMGKK
jgi:rhamnosyltransferase